MAAPSVLPRLIQSCLTARLEARMASRVMQNQVRYKMANKGSRLKEHSSLVSTKKVKTFTKRTKAVQFKEVAAEDPEFLARVPEDDVYFQKYYPIPTYLFEEAIGLHREYCDPMMHDNMGGLVYVDLCLDMSTKKKTKSKGNFKGLLQFPHQFDTKKHNRCIVVCGKEEEVNEALRLGAVYAGSMDLIKDLHPKDGKISRSDYDYAICTPEMIESLFPIRAALKDAFPSVARESIGTDIPKMLSQFQTGYMYESSKEGVIGNVQAPIGTLDMPLEQLTENYKTFIQEVNTVGSKSSGTFVIGIKLFVPPSPEEFKVEVGEYLTNDNKGKKNQATRKEASEDLEDEDDDDISPLESKDAKSKKKVDDDDSDDEATVKGKKRR